MLTAFAFSRLRSTTLFVYVCFFSLSGSARKREKANVYKRSVPSREAAETQAERTRRCAKSSDKNVEAMIVLISGNRQLARQELLHWSHPGQ